MAATIMENAYPEQLVSSMHAVRQASFVNASGLRVLCASATLPVPAMTKTFVLKAHVGVVVVVVVVVVGVVVVVAVVVVVVVVVGHRLLLNVSLSFVLTKLNRLVYSGDSISRSPGFVWFCAKTPIVKGSGSVRALPLPIPITITSSFTPTLSSRSVKLARQQALHSVARRAGMGALPHTFLLF